MLKKSALNISSIHFLSKNIKRIKLNLRYIIYEEAYEFGNIFTKFIQV